MSWLFSNKIKGTLNIIIDIQSGLVRGALILQRDREPIEIVSVITKSYSGKTNIINAEHLTKKNLKLVSEVIEQLAKDSQGNHISSIKYTLSSPWIFSKLKTIKVEYKKETEITPKIIGDIVKEELKENEKTADVYPIEQKIFEIKLNGYAVPAYEGKKAHLLEISLSTSFSSKSFLDKVKATVNRHLHIGRHSFHSALLMQYNALREIFSDKNEYIYIHIHSELTDLIIVKGGLCRYIASFPFGASTLIRKLATKTNSSIEESDSTLSLFQGNKLNDEERAKIHEIITPIVQEWSDLFMKSLENIFDFTSIPRTIYLSAHSHFDLFKEALTFQSKFSFEIISYESLDTGSKIVFNKDTKQSSMMKLYTTALHDTP